MDIDGMRVMSVDDNETNLLIIKAFCESLKLPVESFTSAVDAYASFKEKQYDIIITDYMMPVMNGIEFVKQIRQTDESIPIVMVTAVGDDMKVQLNALEEGTTDFLMKPINAGVFKARVSNLLKLRKALLMVMDKALLLEEEVKLATREVVEREQETLRLLGNATEFKDPETGAHVARVASYSQILSEAYGMDAEMVDIIYNASPFHDIGKVAIPDSILLKPGALNDEEFRKMKEHTTLGFDMLKKSKSSYLKAGSIIAKTHHEKYDGTGYPNGLSGETIPIMGRIVALADVFDALTSPRPYKKAWSFDEALEHMISQKGVHFDPVLIDLFQQNIEKIKDIYENIKD